MNSKVTFIGGIFAVLILLVFSHNPHISGDGTEYYLMIQSIQNHFSPNLTELDLTQARNIATEFGWWLPYEHVNYKDFPGYFLSKNSGLHFSYHFWCYSLFVYPFKFILDLFQVNDLFSFPIANLLIFLVALRAVYAATKSWSLVGLFLFNPVLYYLNWTHPEVFTYSLLTISIALLIDRNYIASIVICAIASWQNPPVMFFITLIIFEYFKDNRAYYKTVLVAAVAILLCGVPSCFYYLYFGVPNLIANLPNSGIKNISFIRLYSIFFDLNLGYLPYTPFVTVTFFILIFNTKQIIKNILLLGVVSIIIISSLTSYNFNSGMSGLLRYAVWLYPIIIFFVYINAKHKYIKIVSILSCTWFALYSSFNMENFNQMNYLSFNKISKFVMSTFPAGYIVDKEVFADRALHNEKYKLIYPINERLSIESANKIYYSDDSGNVRKMLTNAAQLKELEFDPFVNIVNHGIYNEILMKNALEVDDFIVNYPKNVISIDDCAAVISSISSVNLYYCGIYAKEGNSKDSWNWSQRNSKIILQNISNQDIKAYVKFNYSVPNASINNNYIEVISNQNKRMLLNNHGSYYNDFIIPAHKNYIIKFNTNSLKVNAPLDSRNMYFSIINLELNEFNKQQNLGY